MNAINIQNTINKLKSADSYHTQKEYALDDEAIEVAVEVLEKVKNGEFIEKVYCKDCKESSENDDHRVYCGLKGCLSNKYSFCEAMSK
jgi:uncharacterized protein YktB (UPF0637 family)